MKIVATDALPTSIVVKMETPEGRPFWMKVDGDGLHFHSDQNSAGFLTDNPVTKSARDVFEWIRDDVAGNGRKPFGERERIKPRPIF